MCGWNTCDIPIEDLCRYDAYACNSVVRQVSAAQLILPCATLRPMRVLECWNRVTRLEFTYYWLFKMPDFMGINMNIHSSEP